MADERPLNDVGSRTASEPSDTGSDARMERRFRHLLEAASDAILEIDRDGSIVLMNAATERLFGYSREELSGKNVDILVPDEVRSRHAQHRTNYVAHPLPRPMGIGLMLQGQRKDGTRFPVEISLSPFESEEGFRIGAIIRDVTDRVKAEERDSRSPDEVHGRVDRRQSPIGASEPRSGSSKPAQERIPCKHESRASNTPAYNHRVCRAA